MDLEDILLDINSEYEANEDSEARNSQALDSLIELYEVVKQDEDLLVEFKDLALDTCGGIFIPYLFWDELYIFLEKQNNRDYITKLLRAFAQSEFGEAEQAKLKPLLIIFIASERAFEIDKMRAAVLKDAHKSVVQYFTTIISFVEKNKSSSDSWVEKMKLLKNHPVNFEMLRLPIVRLREALQKA